MNNLKEARKKKLLTGEKVAQQLNITRNALSMYETGKREASYETLKKLANIYGVSIDYLLGNSTELTSTSTALTSEQAKDIWFASLPQEDQETINLYLMLSYSDRLRVNGYILSRLNN